MIKNQFWELKRESPENSNTISLNKRPVAYFNYGQNRGRLLCFPFNKV